MNLINGKMRASGHDHTFIPAVGPRADLIKIIEDCYYDDGDGTAVDVDRAALEIEELFVRKYGANL